MEQKKNEDCCLELYGSDVRQSVPVTEKRLSKGQRVLNCPVTALLIKIEEKRKIKNKFGLALRRICCFQFGVIWKR